MKLTMSRIDVISLIDLLDSFEKLCKERNIKFNKYSEEQIMQFLILYKAYKRGEKEPPPFDRGVAQSFAPSRRVINQVLTNMYLFVKIKT